MKKVYSTQQSKVKKEYLDALKFVFSMRYTIGDLRNLSTVEVEFIRERCKEEKIEYFDEMIKELTGVGYDQEGHRYFLSEVEEVENERDK